MKLKMYWDRLMGYMTMIATYALVIVPMDVWADGVSASGRVSGTIGGARVSVSGSTGGAGGDGGPIADVLCAVVGWFNGAVGAGIATLAIIVVGIGALMGKVSWGMAIIVGIGVGVIFGAGSIVEMLGGSGC